jgi:hypothetical protein
LQHRQVKRIDLTPIIEGHMVPTGMMVCSGCAVPVDHGDAFAWLEDGFVFWRFSDGAVAWRFNPATKATVIVDLPDATTYRPGRSSWPSRTRELMRRQADLET